MIERSFAAQNVVAGWLGVPVPFTRTEDMKPRRRPHRKLSAIRRGEADRRCAEARRQKVSA
jgi:hypothetical protein